MYKITTALVSAGLFVATSGASFADPVALRFAVGVPPQVHYNRDLFTPWSETVSAASNGTLEINMFYAGALGHPGEFLEAIDVGAVDIAVDIAAYYPGQFALSQIASLPFMIDDPVQGSMALWSLYESGAYGDMFDGMKMLAISTPTAAMILTTETPVARPEDMHGLTIAASGRISPQVAQAVSAAPIDVPIYEIYQSLSRGTVDGAITYYTAIAPFSLHEVGNYYLDLPLGGSFMMVYMSQERFDALPAEAQAALDNNSGLALSQAFGEVWAAAAQVGQNMITQEGGTIATPSDEDMALWQASIGDIVDNWAADTEGGQALVDALRAELAD